MYPGELPKGTDFFPSLNLGKLDGYRVKLTKYDVFHVFDCLNTLDSC